MESEQMIDQIKAFIAREFLVGQDVGLDATTPLLTYGVINSISVMRLARFISDTYSVEIPPTSLTPKNLSDIRSIANLVASLREAR